MAAVVDVAAAGIAADVAAAVVGVGRGVVLLAVAHIDALSAAC